MKKNITLTALAISAPLFFASCEDAQKALKEKAGDAAKSLVSDKIPTDKEGMTKQASSIMETITGKLSGIKDVDSAKALLPELGKLGTKMGTLKTAASKLGGFKLLENPTVKAAVSKLTAALSKLTESQPKAAEMLKGVIGKMTK